MKARSVAVQGGLAVVALVAAYFTWQRAPEDAAAERVTLLDATKNSLEKIRFSDGTKFVELRREVEGTPLVWVTQGSLPAKTPPPDAGLSAASADGGADAGVMMATITPPEPVPTREMRGNERADAVWARFAPFEGARMLGVLSTEKLAELGLSEAERTLEVTVSGTAHTFTVSKPMPGIIGTWIRNSRTGQVGLLSGGALADLDPMTQVMVDRRLHTFRPIDVDRFTITAGGKSVEYAFTGAEVSQNAKVARTSSPDKPDELVKNWHDKVWNRVIVTEVLGKGELPKTGAPSVELRLDYSKAGSAKGFLEIALDKGSAWARSENTASWVGAPQNVEELVQEARKIVASP